MRKIPTLFLRDPDNMARVTRQVNPECQWVIDGEGWPTRKFDGTCVMLDFEGEWWARREIKPGKRTPAGFVEVDHDDITGKTVGWEPAEQSGFHKYLEEAAGHKPWAVGTYELCGPKINGNPEGYTWHQLLPHGCHLLLEQDAPRDFDNLKATLLGIIPFRYEGIVWHHDDGRMAKIKKRDFE